MQYLLSKFSNLFNHNFYLDNAAKQLEILMQAFEDSGIPKYFPFVALLKNWRIEIKNSFTCIDYRRITNSYIESRNSITRMSSPRQKINLCKSRNPRLPKNSDSPEFLLLCTTSNSNLLNVRRKTPVMIWYFPIVLLPTFFLTNLHLHKACNNIVEHSIVKVLSEEYTTTYFC